ncbi:alpha/beta fold hydrolase [Nocardiopsis ganjiahuensis]|uniref:alpha/beta fold hydrolase n=1 Tax=Nocardiopsis ganjiahuensis TaxID=239984 RepID=UPI00034B39CF
MCTQWATVSAGVLLASLVAVPTAHAAPAEGAAAPTTRIDQKAIDWQPCEDLEPVGDAELECATITVPMARTTDGERVGDLAETVEIALSRVRATGTAEHTVLVNPGGPGSAGRMWAAHTHNRMPEELRETYDVVAFDPRGMGASTPAVTCDPDFFTPVRKDTVPADAAEEQALRLDAEAYAAACAEEAGPLLDHMRTEDTAHDMDAIRVALDLDRVDYLGYSYGSYLGTVYASLYPDSVRAVVLDSVVNPDNPWYESNLVQSRSLDRAAQNFFDWVARHDDTYGLGTDGETVADAYYALRAELRENPLDDTVGPTELEGAVIVVAYSGNTWPSAAGALAARINDGDPAPLLALHEAYGDDADSDPGYGGYLAVQCTDTEWPRNWRTWHADAEETHEDAPFMGWHNMWYNAPCASWEGESDPWFQVGDGPYEHPAYDGDVLIVHATGDGATPVEGSYALRDRLPGSSLVIEDGGLTHGVALTGNTCVDEAVVAYLREGTLPERGAEGPDLTCDARPEPQPRTVQSAPHAPVDRLGPIGLDTSG